MNEFKCKLCDKKIDATPYFEVHEWSYNEHGELLGTSIFYCDICYSKYLYKEI
ncbi:hypothetical protein LCGC14_3075630 [marine sediment metagenome]|uniref:Uncharacterized protein n=1 Tax=marine sediment metagenome TaxID=412755 RepID=A0A0F8Z5H9_9ZZZZ